MTFNEAVFVDAGAWFALADKTDVKHAKAVGLYPSLLTSYRRLVTSNLVIAEAYVLILNEVGHAAAIAFLERVKASPRITLIYSSAEIESEAQATLGRYHDQDFSYTDAVSFTIMKGQKIRKVFAFDKHFLTAGFTVVP